MFKKSTPSIPVGRKRPANPSVNSAVFSYYAKRTPVRTGMAGRQPEKMPAPSLKKRQQAPLLKRCKQLVVFLVIAGLLASSLFITRRVTVVPVGDETSRAFLRDPAIYQAAIDAHLSSSIFNRNKLTINVDRLNKELGADFPELKSVVLTLPLLSHRPTVYIEAAIPAMAIVTGDGTAFVLDEDGHALLGGKQIPAKIKAALPVVTDQSGLRVTSGKVVLPSDSVAFITEVYRQFRAKNIAVQTMVLPIGGSELDVHPSSELYIVKFNLRGNAREEVGTFLAVKHQLESTGKQAQQYIDVRVEQRAYYK